MARLLLFVIFAVWAVGSENASGRAPTAAELAAFLGGFVAIAAIINLWGFLARSHRQTAFLWAVWATRQLTVVWFSVGMLCLHWPDAVSRLLGPAVSGPNARLPLESLPALLGTLPALLTWVAIIAAKYHGERTTRDDTILYSLDEGLPVHPVGGMRSFLTANLRLDLLFTIVPIGLILVLRDVGVVTMVLTLPRKTIPDWAEPAISLLSAAVVFLWAPVLLTRVLQTRSLAASPLRTRLEAMCNHAGLSYRDILLWHTDNHMGNAAVMGVVPQVRYILLSDLLLETMTDEQIEAVFAHELGHVVHKHLTWMGLFVVVLVLAVLGPGKWVGDVSSAHLPEWIATIVIPAAGAIGGLLLLFGGLSRFFERQADVYAARTMQWQTRPAESDAEKPRRWPVGERGAAVFGSALYRVAIINGIPIATRTLSHGSIAGRIEYLREMSGDPKRTGEFDRMMGWIYAALIGLLVVCGAWAAIVFV